MLKEFAHVIKDLSARTVPVWMVPMSVRFNSMVRDLFYKIGWICCKATIEIPKLVVIYFILLHIKTILKLDKKTDQQEELTSTACSGLVSTLFSC